MPSLPNSGLSSEELLLKSLETERSRRLTEDRLRYYTPYPKQAEFHSAGATHRERLLMAANQVGKTYAAAMELAAHASGQYPPWWQGYKFDRAIRAWAAGETAQLVRAPIQFLLLGEPGQHGTGCIPKSALLEVVPARGTAELADIIRVRYVSGDVSTISLKAYSQGRERFQGADRHVTTMTLDDAAHYSAEDRARITAQYPEHERDTRTRGIPQMGSGRVFLVDEEKLLVD